MSLEVTFNNSVLFEELFVQFTGTKIAHARNAIGTNILSLHKKIIIIKKS